MSAMNINSKSEFEEKLRNANITSKNIIINQTDNNDKHFDFSDGEKEIYSFNEKGVSKSRNRLLEKADSDIVIFADDDMIYNDNYEKVIEEEYRKNKNADGILFYVENKNKNREKNKRIGNKKINCFDVMKARIYELSLKRETIQKIKDKKILFNENFGPGGLFYKGEDTIFISDLIKNGINIYSVDKEIGFVYDEKSSWYKGFNDKYFFDQGAIFYMTFPRIYKLIILQYLIRKIYMYRKYISFFQAYKQMILGAKKCKIKN